jgi:hypothetical protein
LVRLQNKGTAIVPQMKKKEMKTLVVAKQWDLVLNDDR